MIPKIEAHPPDPGSKLKCLRHQQSCCRSKNHTQLLICRDSQTLYQLKVVWAWDGEWKGDLKVDLKLWSGRETGFTLVGLVTSYERIRDSPLCCDLTLIQEAQAAAVQGWGAYCSSVIPPLVLRSPLPSPPPPPPPPCFLPLVHSTHSHHLEVTLRWIKFPLNASLLSLVD